MRNFKGIGQAAREEQIVPACSQRQQPERHRGRLASRPGNAAAYVHRGWSWLELFVPWLHLRHK